MFNRHGGCSDCGPGAGSWCSRNDETGIGGRNTFASGVGEFIGAVATKIRQLKTYDPESQGGVERINDCFETSLLPGRQFESPADFNTQLGDWLPRSNAGTVRALKVRPVHVLVVNAAAMLALSPLSPPTGVEFQIRLPRKYYVRVHGNDYSVHPALSDR